MKQILRLGESHGLFAIKRYILDVLLINIGIVWLLTNTAHAQTLIKGTVTDSVSKEPLPGVTITLKGSSHRTATNTKGEYRIFANPGDILIFSAMGFKTIERKTNGSVLNVSLETATSELDEVKVSSGYQYIPKERATGSFTYIDNDLLNRSVSTNVLDRLKGVASGVLFDNSVGTTSGLNVRGRNTIYANTEPLIVVDNFAYDGELSTINPNDVFSVTILKDAAAASIWGVRASNGVIVITTKKGQFNQASKISVTSNVTIEEKPDLFGKREMSSSAMIDVEKFLYENHAFDVYLEYLPYFGPSPLVDILTSKTLSYSEKEAQINSLRTINNKSDQLKYYYRSPVRQQHAINISGGGRYNKYYLSAGYDRNLQSLKNDDDSRLSVNASNTYYLLKNKLEINSGITYTANKINTNENQNSIPDRTYIPLVNLNGDPNTTYPYRKAWLDTLGSGQLLDWTMRPLEEFNNSGSERELTTYLLNTGLTYHVNKSFNLNLLYQYSKGTSNQDRLQTMNAYYTRDLINQFIRVNAGSGQVFYPVPLGDILDTYSSDFASHNVRGQVNFNHTWKEHALTAIAGTEWKDYHSQNRSDRQYGYTADIATISPVDYVNTYYNTVSSRNEQIPFRDQIEGITDRYVSYYTNATYTYKSRYNVSGSARKDASNLFGVKSNNRSVPLWSVGLSWELSEESFYKTAWLPYLKLRLTNGYNGNVDKTLSAFTTAQSNSVLNVFGANTAKIINPPNPSLRWEKINITNIGLDFGILEGSRINGTIEYYIKKGKDIIGDSPLAPTTGITEFRGNTANTSGRGIDLTINSLNLHGSINWNTTFLLSYNTDKITKYMASTTALGPHEGKPYNAVYGYRWAGLHPGTGDPQGYLNGETSNNWGSIVNVDSSSSVKYMGSGMPTCYGSFRNTFEWKNLTLSFNILYKMGYYFRANSISYTNLLVADGSGLKYPGNSDFSKRWQQPGDEVTTNVPSMTYPGNTSRDQFYANSEILVQRGDNIRLQDVQLSYSILKSDMPSMPVSRVRFYIYASDLAVLWKDNERGIDPDFTALPMQKSFSLGINLDF